VIAETLLGHGDLACEYFRAYLPAAYNTRSEVRQIEPLPANFIPAEKLLAENQVQVEMG